MEMVLTMAALVDTRNACSQARPLVPKLVRGVKSAADALLSILEQLVPVDKLLGEHCSLQSSFVSTGQ